MRKATIFVPPFYLNNQLFNISDRRVNRDNCLYSHYLLKERFKEKNIDLSTQDINTLEKADFIIYIDMPPKNDILENKRNYLLLMEAELIRPDNWDIKRHKQFKKIFTWHDDWVDNKKYFKSNFPNKLPNKININHTKQKKLCTIIAGNKLVKHPLELYSERRNAIRWFEKNHLEDFDLYGIGWDRFYSSNKYINFLVNKLGLSNLLVSKFPSYKGIIDSKIDVLKKYKFSICYENAKEIPGYITEKILDCLFAGCIPIYWGAPNVTNWFSANAFIDKRNFKTYEELYQYIKNMPDNEYLNYIEAMKKLVTSKSIYPYGADYFTNTIIREILNDNTN